MTGTRRKFTATDDELLIATYRVRVDAGELGQLAAELGREKSVLCNRAKRLGLTDAVKGKAIANAAMRVSVNTATKWKRFSHPKGATGITHSASTRLAIGKASVASQARQSEDERADRTKRGMETKMARYGTRAMGSRGSWKAGWREIGGERKFYRSRWEANYARYLNWLQHRGDILDWKHESETFWFDAIKRGVRSYLPDFRVWENDGTSRLHEVKGWMDARSKTILKRMAKYHPGETIVLIQAKQYNEIERRLGGLIEGWE